MSNLVIVAIPAEDDYVWKLSSEKVPHCTLLFLGDSDAISSENAQKIVEFVEHAVTVTDLGPLGLDVDRRDILGEDKADVLFFRKGWSVNRLQRFRHQLLQNDAIKTAYDSTEQFPEWQPHLTMGYPETPAKEDDRDYPGIRWVQFDRIAVWIDDFDGPEFRLQYNDVDLEVCYSSMNEARIAAGLEALEHFGVKGMKWGQRKVLDDAIKRGVIDPNASKADQKWLYKHTYSGQKRKGGPFGSKPVIRDLADNARKDSKKEFKQIEQKYDKLGTFKDGNWYTTDKGKAEYKQYTKELETVYMGHVNKHFNKLPEKVRISPTGKKELQLHESKHTWDVRVVEVAHIAGEPLFSVRPVIAENGVIIDLELVETSMEQSDVAAIGAEFLEHFGVKGMRWGKRKDRAIASIKSGAKKFGRGLNELATIWGDSSFEDAVTSPHKWNEVHDRGVELAQPGVKRINAKPKYQNQDFLRPSKLRTEYYKEHQKNFIDSLEKAAAEHINPSGNRRYAILEKDNGNWELRTVDVKHADDIPTGLEVTLIKDEKGYITSFSVEKFPEDSMTQTLDLGADFLAHHGIKGMKWGHRKEAPSAVPASAMSRVPHGEKAKTKIIVAGGANHPAHEDAIKVAEATAKLKKSGPAALSNRELQDVANRLRLEQQATQLTASAPRRFVTNLLKQQGEQSAKSFVRDRFQSGEKGGGKNKKN